MIFFVERLWNFSHSLTGDSIFQQNYKITVVHLGKFANGPTDRQTDRQTYGAAQGN